MKWGAIFQHQLELICPIFVVVLFACYGIALDQNFPASSSMGYVNLPVTSDMPLSSNFSILEWAVDRNFYSTVSLPQNIVSSIDVSVLFSYKCSNHKKLFHLCMCIIRITYWIRIVFLYSNPIHLASVSEGSWRSVQMYPTQSIMEYQSPKSPQFS